ncbi:MAG: ABC transporter ATP-binding protein/permease [Clostridiales Family XIII bacterium]|jgi:ATP-binding cassette subfamily B protein|nr:ABC transporter ATP-binding protein/permease [Clostridiales Family XIII bacterium]
MAKTDDINTHTTAYLIKRFVPYFKKYKWVLLLDLFCATLTTLCDLVLPVIVRYLTDLGMSDLHSLTVRVILTVGALYLGLRIIDTIANYFMANIGHVMGAKIETDMRRDLFSHLQELSYSYYSNTKVGQLMSRITSDLFDVTEFAHHCPEEFYIAVLKIVVSFTILCSVNVPLTIIIFAIIPIMIFCSMQFNNKMRRAFKKSRNQLGEINAQVEDSLQGVRVVKSFANEDMEQEKFEEGNLGFLDIKKEQYKYMAAFQGTTRIFDGIMYITVVVAGALFMMNKLITPADFMAYLLFVTMLLATVRRLVEFTEQFQRGMTGIERFIEVMDEPVEIKDRPNAVVLGADGCGEVKGDINFENASFAYDDSDEYVLKNIDLHIRPGENIALVGPSGSGKTTLCNLIPRFYDVTEGRITIDGFDVRDVTTHSLRSMIGMVQQDVYLFSGSIRDNIEYGKPGASDDEIVRAAQFAGAHEFILGLADGYDTYVGERGVKLSGGQKQRISIARVFLKNPPILILDEATSALDNESERVVQESLAKLAAGRTTLTIAHRLSTIRNAQTILVLTEDGIEERGNHETLMAKGGLYSKLYHLYTDTDSGTSVGD